MEKTRYDPSIKLENELETDHYETARDVFDQHGGSKDVLKQAISVFEKYDGIKAQVVKDMKAKGDPEDYTEHVEGFTSERAIEIIHAAFLDHKAKNTDKHGNTKSRNWRKA